MDLLQKCREVTDVRVVGDALRLGGVWLVTVR